MRTLATSRLGKFLLYGLAGLALYYGNVEVQSYMGRQALAGTGLLSVPLANALATAGTENKLVLLDISAIWCSSCRRLDSSVFSDPSVRRLISERFIFTRLEYESEEGQEFLEKHEVSGFPTVWILNGRGEIVKRVRITFEPSEFLDQLKL